MVNWVFLHFRNGRGVNSSYWNNCFGPTLVEPLSLSAGNPQHPRSQLGTQMTLEDWRSPVEGCREGAWRIHVGRSASFLIITLPKTNSSPLKIGHPRRKVVFQPSIFRCYACWGRAHPLKGVFVKLKIHGHIKDIFGKYDIFENLE